MIISETKLNMLKKLCGFSLVEMLIVVGIFSILAVITTQTLASSLRSSKKSENIGKVRENVEYAMNYIERTLRTAKKLDFDDTPGGVSDICGGNTLYFYNTSGISENFAFGSSKIQYNGSDITSAGIRITSFAVICTQGISGEPDSVQITIEAQDATTSSAESAKYKTTTKISLRNYSRN